MARRSPAAEQLTADSPLELRVRLRDALHRRGAATPWCTVLPELATTDWVAAAVISSSLGMRPPSPPTASQLGRKRSLRSLGNIELGVGWGYDLHELRVTFGSWVRILNGSERNVRRSYLYEGERASERRMIVRSPAKPVPIGTSTLYSPTPIEWLLEVRFDSVGKLNPSEGSSRDTPPPFRARRWISVARAWAGKAIVLTHAV